METFVTLTHFAGKTERKGDLNKTCFGIVFYICWRKHLFGVHLCTKNRVAAIFLFYSVLLQNHLSCLCKCEWRVMKQQIFTLHFGFHSARAFHFSLDLWSEQFEHLFPWHFLYWIMGNALQRNSPGDCDVKTPSISALTPAEVDIIKTTWKIPSSNVSVKLS